MIRRLLQRLFAPLDMGIIVPMLLLLGCGLMTLYSAAGEDADKVMDQLRNLAIAATAMWLIALIPTQYLLQVAAPIYLAGVLMLVGVALFGEISNGARRWLDIGVGRIQPSELMKIALPLMLAWYFHRRETHLRLLDFLVAAVILAVPVLLIVKQPDLGTGLLIASSGFYILFLAGLSWKFLLGLGTIIGASLPLAWSVMHDYQRQRVLTLLDPAQDPLGAGYHIIQSTIALGSGGLSGKGWMNGTQTHLDFLPERTTDFIFAVYGEEFGLIGNLILLILYFALIIRGMMIAYGAGNLFGRLVAGALTLTMFTYAFVNMGMVSGILPVVGVPLPLVSYGGTSLVTILISLGILMGIQSQKKLVPT
jgi:rod shape determining protein RodA